MGGTNDCDVRSVAHDSLSARPDKRTSAKAARSPVEQWFLCESRVLIQRTGRTSSVRLKRSHRRCSLFGVDRCVHIRAHWTNLQPRAPQLILNCLHDTHRTLISQAFPETSGTSVRQNEAICTDCNQVPRTFGRLASFRLHIGCV